MHFQFNSLFYYSQEYDSIIHTTLIDTIKNSIYGDMILVSTDPLDTLHRNYEIMDSLSNGDPIKAKRSVSFKVKYSFIPYDGLYHRKSTDCNDNYQKDEEEIVVFDSYTNPYGTNPKSFEAWCLKDACSDGNSISESSCCLNNSLGC